ncbi:MAG: LysR family transcriptional regulator [Oscillospiraceae bacterium]|nr:LysR family transcriptional regulator [Oscillospiraceae bacterium]
MEFKQLESFAAVVRLRSFTRAAEQLYISQPTISTHIRALEEELNMRLILRTTKSIEVTAEGQKLYEYAVNILQLRDRMLQECSSEAKRIIHLGASTIPSAYILPEVLPKFGGKHTNTFFVIHQSDSKGVLDGLTDGIFDVGLIGMDVEKESLTCEPFCEDRMVLITPVTEQFLKLQRKGVSAVELLTTEPVILREKGSGSKKSVDRFLEEMGISDEQLNITARVNDPEAIKNLVAQGLGISFISQRAAQNFIREKRLLAFDLPEHTNTRNLYLAYRTDHGDYAPIREFVEFVKYFYSAGK